MSKTEELLPAIIEQTPKQMVDMAKQVANSCKDIVEKTATRIQGKKYIQVEGWQTIANAHGCVLSARGVERIDGGVRAIGEVRRVNDGAVIATGEGFVGDDEKMWGKRDEYAKRAMAQTRAMSRAGRSAFAYVVVMMENGFQTTPAEEIPSNGFKKNDSQQSSVDLTTDRAAALELAANAKAAGALTQKQYDDWKPKIDNATAKTLPSMIKVLNSL